MTYDKKKGWKIYPLASNETYSYSVKIKDYRILTVEDKRILVNDFKEFYKYVFWHQRLPCPTRDQLFMAKYVSQLISSQDPLMLQAQRGLAKSLTTQILCAWMLLRNKNEVIVVVSATSARAESFITFVKQLLQNIPLLKHLAPQGSDRSSSRKIDVNGRIPNDSPSLCAFGVTSAKTGSRASFIIYDDVEIPENSDTAQKREKLLAGVRDTANLGIAGVFRELAICTPQSSESVYNTMLNDGFKRCIIPAEYPEDISVYEGDLAPHIVRELKINPHKVGMATDKRNNEKHLAKQKLKGKSRYKLHYMLDTSMSDAERYPLKLSDLIVMDLDIEKAPVHIEYSSEKKDTLYELKHSGFRGDFLYKPRYYNNELRKNYEGVVMYIDPSGRGKDETGWAVTAQLNGMIFILGFGGLKGGYEVSELLQLATLAERYKVNEIQIEANFGDGTFTELLKPYLRNLRDVNVEEYKVSSQKEKRIIQTLEPALMQHRVIIDKGSLVRDSSKDKADYRFTYQMTHITEARNSLVHDDILEAVAMAVGHWTESMARNVEEEIKMYEEALIDEENKKFLEEMCDIKVSNNFNNW